MGLQSIVESLDLPYNYNFFNGTFDEENQWFLCREMVRLSKIACEQICRDRVYFRSITLTTSINVTEAV